jgi:hypothetical protein
MYEIFYLIAVYKPETANTIVTIVNKIQQDAPVDLLDFIYYCYRWCTEPWTWKKLQMQLGAPDDERYAARNTLSPQYILE